MKNTMSDKEVWNDSPVFKVVNGKVCPTCVSPAMIRFGMQKRKTMVPIQKFICINCFRSTVHPINVKRWKGVKSVDLSYRPRKASVRKWGAFA